MTQQTAPIDQDDVRGYMIPAVIVVAVAQQLAMRELVTAVLGVFGPTGSPSR
jgi:uncharacterized membrane protein YdfJ with MMPL/SSD domain